MGPRLKESVQPEPQTGADGNKKLTIYRFGDMDVVELDESSLATPNNYS